MSIRSFFGGGGGGPSDGSSNAHANQNIGFVVRDKVVGIYNVLAAVGASVVQAAISMTTPETFGVSLTQKVSGSPALAPQSSGVQLNSVLTSNNTPQNSGTELVQVKYDLTHRAGSTSATGGSPWANSTNAQGTHDGASATCAQTVTTPTSGAPLTLSYAAQVNRTDLTISSVKLYSYAQYAPGLVSPGTVRLEYSLNSGTNWTIIKGPLTTAFNTLAAGESFDITAAVAGDWSKLGTTFRARWVHTAAASATPSTLTVDACELEIIASRTDAL